MLDVGADDDAHRQGRRRRARRGLRAALPGRRHLPRDALVDGPRRRRRDLVPGRRAGPCPHGLRRRGLRAGRLHRRPRQHVRGRGQTAALRRRGHRPAGRPDRDPRDRRRRPPTRHCRRPTCSARPSTARPRRPSSSASRGRSPAAALAEVERQLRELPTRDVAGRAWADYGEVVVVAGRKRPWQWPTPTRPSTSRCRPPTPTGTLAHLRNYGTLCVGEEATITFSDKVIGTNHTLPTGRAARYTGGLWVGKFLKTVTYQRCTREGALVIAPTPGASPSRAHVRSRQDGISAHRQVRRAIARPASRATATGRPRPMATGAAGDRLAASTRAVAPSNGGCPSPRSFLPG